MTTIVQFSRALSKSEAEYINGALRNTTRDTWPAHANWAASYTPHCYPGDADSRMPGYVAVDEETIGPEARGMLYDAANSAFDKAIELKLYWRDKYAKEAK